MTEIINSDPNLYSTLPMLVYDSGRDNNINNNNGIINLTNFNIVCYYYFIIFRS